MLFGQSGVYQKLETLFMQTLVTLLVAINFVTGADAQLHVGLML